MDENWTLNWFRDRFKVLGMVIGCLLFQNLDFCWSLNHEGLTLLRFKERVVNDPFGSLSNWKDDDGEIDPCSSWFGVECSDEKVVVLNLRDLCLEGTLAPEIRNLVHIKSIILRNNLFTGIIPEGIGHLEELEVLDLGYNHFNGPLPADFEHYLSLSIILLDHNVLLGSLSTEIYDLQMLSEFQVNEDWLSNVAKNQLCKKRPISWYISAIIYLPTPFNRKLSQDRNSVHRILQQVAASPRPTNRITFPAEPFSRSQIERPTLPSSPASEPSSSPSSSSEPPSSSTKSFFAPPHKPQTTLTPESNVSPSPSQIPVPDHSSKNHHLIVILAGAIGGAVLAVLVIGIWLYRNNKVVTVRPWATGLSGQLQKAFVTGVPKLKRSELEAACEDFSNVIGSSPIGTVYKGTLSNGVEIAVASVTITSIKDWSKTLELQFRKKVDTLSKVNHKNFVNLIGYCEEEEHFTRMMVFEYAPNGTLFEHIHIKESEHLDWNMRLRIAMGMVYCLEHLHQLKPPTAHNNLNSSSIRLSEDYACKVAEFSFGNKIATAEVNTSGTKHKTPSASLESNVYDFGVILFEMVTGRLPYSVDNALFENWAADYLEGEQSLKEMVDPTLSSYQEEQLVQIGEVIKSCVQLDTKQRPIMKEVSSRLREITGITPDRATPRLSPLWWAELEIISVDAN